MLKNIQNQRQLGPFPSSTRRCHRRSTKSAGKVYFPPFGTFKQSQSRLFSNLEKADSESFYVANLLLPGYLREPGGRG